MYILAAQQLRGTSMKANIDFFREKLTESHIEFNDVVEFITTWESNNLFESGGFFFELRDKRWGYLTYTESEIDWTTYNEKPTLKEIAEDSKIQPAKIKWNQNPEELNMALGNKPKFKKTKHKQSREYTYHAVWKTYEPKPVALFKDEKVAKQFARQNIKNVLWEIKPFTFQEIS